MLSQDILDRANSLRSEWKDLAQKVKVMHADAKILQKNMTAGGANQEELDRVEELISNAELSYRAGEDMVMRLGKVIQSNNLGVNVYDKKAE